jgi:hypothetical protein
MPKIYDIKNLILVGAMLCALGMMTACKSGTANNKEKTLVGHWETVAATEEWDCSESPVVAAGSAVDFHTESTLRSRARPVFAPKQHPAHERGETDRMKQQIEQKQ